MPSFFMPIFARISSIYLVYAPFLYILYKTGLKWPVFCIKWPFLYNFSAYSVYLHLSALKISVVICFPYLRDVYRR